MNSGVLVTGANGFLGHALCKELLAHGLQVTAMVRRADAFLPQGVDTWLAPELPLLADDAAQRLSTIHTIVHTAGRAHVMEDQSSDPLAAFRRINTAGTMVLARMAAASGVRRFIFVSTIGVNGRQRTGHALHASDHPEPDSPYAQSKWEAEQGLLALQAETGMAVFCVRPPLIYGPSAPGNFALLAKLVAKGWPLPLGGLRAPRSFVALDNVVDLLTHMVCHPSPPSGVYLVADSQVTTTTDFIRAMAQGMGQNLSLIPVPAGVLLMLARLVGRGEQIRKMSVPLAVDIRSTETRLGWTPSVSMEAAMQRAFSDSRSLLPFVEPTP